METILMQYISVVEVGPNFLFTKSSIFDIASSGILTLSLTLRLTRGKTNGDTTLI